MFYRSAGCFHCRTTHAYITAALGYVVCDITPAFTWEEIIITLPSANKACEGNVFTFFTQQTPPQADTPPWADTPSRQTPTWADNHPTSPSQTPPPPSMRWPLQWTVRIPLECILVNCKSMLNGIGDVATFRKINTYRYSVVTFKVSRQKVKQGT